MTFQCAFCDTLMEPARGPFTCPCCKARYIRTRRDDPWPLTVP